MNLENVTKLQANKHKKVQKYNYPDTVFAKSLGVLVGKLNHIAKKDTWRDTMVYLKFCGDTAVAGNHSLAEYR